MSGKEWEKKYQEGQTVSLQSPHLWQTHQISCYHRCDCGWFKCLSDPEKYTGHQSLCTLTHTGRVTLDV